MSDNVSQSLTVGASNSASVKSSHQPLNGLAETRADSGKTTGKNSPTKLTATARTHPSELRAIQTLKKEDSEDILEKFRTIRHENILLVREYFTHEDSIYMVFDDLPVTLDHLVACDYYPRDTQVLSALAQILSGLSFLHACGYNHQALICSNILLGMDGTIQIAALDYCVKGPPDQAKSINAVASIATLLM
ncbi:hypothetical protein EYB26_008641 [Talaromyces marneffei]|uniref:uncharacterized protein n=1 Tax=Talaromyces marneffei TaxID=37727 RepID=UPI0012A990CD|nr:uncharacterized protein EYB26_008641 [Talaromyces marneffei]QGA20931.1 hypothetical protein EYB26_008641 [Talaromyces marneffei]